LRLQLSSTASTMERCKGLKGRDNPYNSAMTIRRILALIPLTALLAALLAWHLTRAAIQLDPVFYDQMSDYGLKAKRLLGALAERPERLPAASRQAIVEYAT